MNGDLIIVYRVIMKKSEKLRGGESRRVSLHLYSITLPRALKYKKGWDRKDNWSETVQTS